MAIPLYLAMTAAEFSGTLPEHPAWMSCHFSQSDPGLSNLPRHLPEQALVLVDDLSPIRGHSPELVKGQLEQLVRDFQCTAVLLDFQRPDCPETRCMAEALQNTLPCPVFTSELYVGSGPVFLPPPPLHLSLHIYLEPWKGRDIWLDMAPDSETLLLTEDGCRILPMNAPPSLPCLDSVLHCQYQVSTEMHAAHFLLTRGYREILSLLDAAASMGVRGAVGLYRELLQTESA